MTLFGLLLLTSTWALSQTQTSPDSEEELPKTPLDLFFEKLDLGGKLKNDLLDLDIQADINLPSLTILNAINIDGGYHYEVNPSYLDQHYMRFDIYKLNGTITPGKVIKKLADSPFAFTVNRDSKILFLRQFPKKSEALKAHPYRPAQLPINSKLAQKLNVGDFVSIPATMNYMVSYNLRMPKDIPLGLGVGASLSAVISGDYNLQIFKIDETHVRLKIISTNSMSEGANAHSGVDFNAFGLNLASNERINYLLNNRLQDIISRIIDVDFLNFGLANVKGANYMADYVFDLTDKEAQAAYDQIMSSTYKLKDVLVADKLLNAKDLSDRLISTSQLADYLFTRDINKNIPYEKLKVARIFKGFNNHHDIPHHFQVSFIDMGLVHDNNYSDNLVTYIDHFDFANQFDYPTYSKFNETYFGKSILKFIDQVQQVFFGLIPLGKISSDDDLDPDIGVRYDRKDKLFFNNEQSDVLEFLKQNIPAKYLSSLSLNSWLGSGFKVDAKVFAQVVIKSGAMNYLKTVPSETIKIKLIAFLKSVGALHKKSQFQDADERVYLSIDQLKQQDYYESADIDHMVDIFKEAFVFGQKVHRHDLNNLIKMYREDLFQKYGLSFLISLLPENKLNELIYIRLNLQAKDEKEISFEFGKLVYKPIYDELATLQDRLSNRGYDLRIKASDLEVQKIPMFDPSSLEFDD